MFRLILDVEDVEPIYIRASDTKGSKDMIAVEQMLRLNIIDGYSNGTAKPDKYITRAEAMTAINKLLGRNPSETYVKSLGFNPFNDLKENKWYYVTVLEATITHDYYLEDKTDVEIKWENWR